MKKRKLLLTVFSNMFAICIGSMFNNRTWAINIRRNGCEAISKALNVRLDIQSLKLNRKGRIIAKDIVILNNKSVVTINHFECAISLWSILKRKPRLTSLFIEKVTCTIEPSTFEKPALCVSDGNIQTTFLQRYIPMLCKLPGILINNMPDTVLIQRVDISARIMKKDFEVKLKNIILEKEVFSLCIAATGIYLPYFTLHGSFNKQKRSFIFNNQHHTNTQNPILVEIPQQNIYLLTNSVMLEIVQTGNHQFSFYCKIKDYRIKWNALSADEIEVPLSAIRFDCQYSSSSFTIEKTSFCQFNEMHCNFSGAFYFTREKTVDLHLSLAAMPVKSFLNSFPYFTTRKLYRLLLTGNIPSITVFFTFKLNEPLDYTFRIETSRQEKIEVAGIPEDWTDITLPFTHHVYDNNKYIRSIPVSSTNSNYQSIDRVPRQLAEIIVFAEDQNFFVHYGLDDFYIGYAIMQNLLKRKFLRGGSTITMQLVRNLYLKRNKNLYRKIEEVFISLLLENVFRVPKTKLLEIYLNIIEFGPDIYGIAEACAYYFLKPPEKLTVKECLILTYIIPRPKFFMEAFECASLQLKCNLKEHIRYTSEKLFQKGIITDEDMKTLSPEISIKGSMLSLEEV